MATLQKLLLLSGLVFLQLQSSLRGGSIPSGNIVRGFRTVVHSDQPLEGLPAVLVGPITRWSLSQNGVSSFVADTAAFNNGTIWRETSSGGLEYAALPTPFDTYSVNHVHAVDSGKVVFSSLDGIAIWSGIQFDTPQLIARTSQPAIGADGNPMEGTSWTLLDLESVSPSGAFLFTGRFTREGQAEFEEGLWKYDPTNGLRLALLKGEQAPDAPAGVIIQNVSSNDNIRLPLINRHGAMTFSALLEGPINEAGLQHAVYSDRDGELKRTLYVGGPAPGFSPGAEITSIDTPKLNDAGDIVLRASIANSPVAEENGLHLLVDSGDGSGLRSVVKNLDPAPGTSSVFDRLGLTADEWGVNGAGQVGIIARTSDLNYGFWMEDENFDLQLLSIDDAPVPGLTDVFVGRHRNTGPIFNALGNAAYSLALSGPGVTPDDDRGFFVRGTDGVLRMLIRQGDYIEVAPGDFRQISGAGILNTHTGGQDGLEVNLNDRGNLLVSMYFTDGTEGLFMITVPEPGMLAHCLWASLLLSLTLRPRPR